MSVGQAKQFLMGATALLALPGLACARLSPMPSRSALPVAHRQQHYPAAIVPSDEAEPESDDSLAQAIAEAYESNPVLAAKRYELRATDDALGIALSQTRASAQVQVSGGYDYTDPGRKTQASRSLIDRLNNPHIERNDLGAQVIVDQPLSTGGRARADIEAAGADIHAGRETLRGSEGDLLVDLIGAYVDVRRDSAAVRIRTRNIEVLEQTLDEVIARREAGELTRTDIAQAQTQLQSAKVQLNGTQAQLEQSRASFTALVGREPGVLAPPPPLPLIPASIDDAFDTADQMNPELSAAIQAERASRARIAAARAEGHPTLALRGIAGTTGEAVPFHGYSEDFSLSGRATLTIPLTNGGRVSSQVHQALDRNSADRLRIEVARRQMVQNIVSAWNQMVTAKRNEDVQKAQLEAARVYYEGTFEEYRAGLRSTFDVLYAQNSLRDTEIALLANARDLYVAKANLLRQIGQLETSKLVTGTALYDPSAHVRTVERRAALPWDGAVRVLDSMGAPGQHQQRIEQPARLPDTPAMARANGQPGALPLITHSPIVPIPGTTGRPEQSKQR